MLHKFYSLLSVAQIKVKKNLWGAEVCEPCASSKRVWFPPAWKQCREWQAPGGRDLNWFVVMLVRILITPGLPLALSPFLSLQLFLDFFTWGSCSNGRWPAQNHTLTCFFSPFRLKAVTVTSYSDLRLYP